jgi:hypothetical protein
VQFDVTVPTVADRVAQEVARRYLEPILEPVFHTDSYGYRPGKSATEQRPRNVRDSFPCIDPFRMPIRERSSQRWKR